MTDDISKVVREMRDSCDTVGCGGRHGYCDKCTWADRLESATTPAEVGAVAWFIDDGTTKSFTTRQVDADLWGKEPGYTITPLVPAAAVATLARQLAEAKERIESLTTANELLTASVESRGARYQQAESQLAEATRRLGEVEAYRDATFDGYAVYSELSDEAHRRTSVENVADVLDALNRVARLASDSEGSEADSGGDRG